MKWVLVALLAVAVTLPASGCGTVCNLASGNPDNFGGVQRDIQFAAGRGGLLPQGSNVPEESATQGPAGASAGGVLVALAAYGADLSLSLVADTLTLPLVIYLRQRHEGATDSTAPAN